MSVTVVRLRSAHVRRWSRRAFSDRAGDSVGEGRRIEGEGRRRVPGSARAAPRPAVRCAPSCQILSCPGSSSPPIRTPAPRSSRATRTSSRCSTVTPISRSCTSPRCGRSRAARISFSACRTRALYTRDVSNMRLAMRRDDVAAIVEPLARRLAEQLVAEQTNRIDVPNDLSLLVPTAIVTDYFGIAGAPEQRSRRLGDVDVLVSLRRSRGRSDDRPQGARCRGRLPFHHRCRNREPQGVGRGEGRRARPLSRPAEGQSARDGRSRHSQQSDRAGDRRDPDDLQGLRPGAGPVARSAAGARVRAGGGARRATTRCSPRMCSRRFGSIPSIR